MLARKFRLPATVSFTHAQFLSSRSFSVRIQKNDLTYTRYGFVVTKKISKRAHVRNRTKRKVRACMEKLFSRFLPGYDMIFLLTPAAVAQPTQTICIEVETVLGKFLAAL